MSRLTWAIVAILIALGLYGVYVNRSSNEELRNFLGMWQGKLNAGPQSMKGYLRFKGGRKEFELHLEAAQQEIDLKGNWTLVKPTQMELKVTDVKVNDFGGASKRDPNKPYIPNADVQSAYGKPLVFTLAPDKQTLTSLPITFGQLTASHEFKKTWGNIQ
ncbi:MAG TPA: hypothetical protein VK934_05985 [Fimbriimonas sp.]|nr:hypothetical protein [Fimbriimonas sp.]